MVISALVIGLATAWPLGHVGTRYVAQGVHAKEGITLAGPLASGGRGVFAAMATFAVFAVLVVTCRHCVRVREWRPLAIPAFGYVGLAAVRGGGVKFGDLSSIWTSRAGDGDATAIVSTIAVIALTIAVLVDAARTSSNVRPQRRRGRATGSLFVARSGLNWRDTGHRAAHGNLRERHQRTTGR